jgi:hypothetical protein
MVVPACNLKKAEARDQLDYTVRPPHLKKTNWGRLI